jgi:Uma2 family endonuclease
MDVDAFMCFLEPRPKCERWDLIDGIAVLMDPVTLVHRQIACNLAFLLGGAFTAGNLDLLAYVNACVRNPGVKNFQPQPDVVAKPGIARPELYAEDYHLVAEVLSPTNTGVEIDLKLPRYCEAPGNLYALVIDPYEMRVEMYAKKSCRWEPLVLKRPDVVIEMSEFGLRCLVADLYRGTPLDRNGLSSCRRLLAGILSAEEVRGGFCARDQHFWRIITKGMATEAAKNANATVSKAVLAGLSHLG